MLEKSVIHSHSIQIFLNNYGYISQGHQVQLMTVTYLPGFRCWYTDWEPKVYVQTKEKLIQTLSVIYALLDI